LVAFSFVEVPVAPLRFAPYLPLLLMVPSGNQSSAEALRGRFTPNNCAYQVVPRTLHHSTLTIIII